MIQPEVQGQNCLYVGCYHSRCNAVVSSDAMDEFLRRMQCDNLPLHCSVQLWGYFKCQAPPRQVLELPGGAGVAHCSPLSQGCPRAAPAMSSGFSSLC